MFNFGYTILISDHMSQSGHIYCAYPNITYDSRSSVCSIDMCVSVYSSFECIFIVMYFVTRIPVYLEIIEFVFFTFTCIIGFYSVQLTLPILSSDAMKINEKK